jgi:hypothetical protein
MILSDYLFIHFMPNAAQIILFYQHIHLFYHFLYHSFDNLIDNLIMASLSNHKYIYSITYFIESINVFVHNYSSLEYFLFNMIKHSLYLLVSNFIQIHSKMYQLYSFT